MARSGVALLAASAVIAPASAASASPARHMQFLTEDVPGASSTLINGINDSGVFTGTYTDTLGRSNGFIMAGTKFTEIDYPGATATYPSGISDNDTVAGSYADQSGVLHGFLRTAAGAFTSLTDPDAGTASGQGTEPNGLNRAGEVVGFYFDQTGEQHGFVYNGGVFTTVDTSGAQGTVLTAVNDSGTYVGFYLDSHDATIGFANEGGHIDPINAPGSLDRKFQGTVPSGVSDTGTVSGDLYTAHLGYTSTGWLLTASGFNSVADPKASTIPVKGQEVGTGINNISPDGTAIAGYYFSGGTDHGYVLDLTS